jgi:hypothetical protein
VEVQQIQETLERTASSAFTRAAVRMFLMQTKNAGDRSRAGTLNNNLAAL